MKKKNAGFLFGVVTACFASIGNGALTDNLVHYYTFEEDSYSSGWLPSAGTYTLGGAKAGFTKGKIGQALGSGSSFTGTAGMSGEYFQPGTGDWTLSLWVKRAPASEARGLVARGGYSSGGAIGGWQVVRNPTGTLSLNYIDGSYRTASSTVTLPDDTWGYATIRRKGNLFQLFLNGTSIISNTLSSPTVNISPSTTGDTWNREFRSGLTNAVELREGDAADELAVWTRALADSEILKLYNNGEGRSIFAADFLHDGLQQYFPLDSDFTITDGQGDLSGIGENCISNFLSSGKFGGALAGTTGKIRGTGSDNARFHPGIGAFTLSFWYKPSTEDVPANGDVILSKGALRGTDHNNPANTLWNAGWNLYLNADRSVSLRLFEGVNNADSAHKTLTSTATLAPGEWVHLAYTRDGASVTLYINGVAQANTITLSSAAASVAVNNSTYGREFDTRAMREGEMIDEIAFWNRALSTSELQTIAAGTASLAELASSGDGVLMRHVAEASENWSSSAWSTAAETGLPWSDAAIGAELTFGQNAASLVLDQPVALERLFIKSTEAGGTINLSGSETLSLGDLGLINTTTLTAGHVAAFTHPIAVGSLDLKSHGTPAAATPALGRVRFGQITAESLTVRSGFIELPDSASAPNHQVGLITLRGGSGAAVAQSGVFNSTYSGNLAVSETGYIHVRDTASGSPDATLTLSGRLGGKGTLHKHNTGTLALSGTTAIDGSIYMAGGTTAFFTGDHTLTDRASVQAATLAIGGDARLSLGRLVANDASGASSTIRQTGGDVIITGTNNTESNAASIILAHWNALCTYTMTGGSLTSAAAKIRAVHDGRLTWNIENATVSAPGIYSSLDNAHASTITLGNGAAMTLGAAGISLPSATTFTLNDGATLAFTASATSNKALTLGGTDSGATLTLGGTTTLPGFRGNGTLAVASANPATLLISGDGGSGTPLINLGKNITLAAESPLTLASIISGGSVQTDNLTLTHWRVHLGADAEATRITTFNQPPDLDGVAVSFTADAATLPGGYTLGTFLNAGKATYTGLPSALYVDIDADGGVRIRRAQGVLVTLH